MIWIFSIGLSAFGVLGLFLTARAYKKGETIQLKKVIGAILFVLLGVGVMLQKVEVIDVPQLRGLVTAFDR